MFSPRLFLVLLAFDSHLLSVADDGATGERDQLISALQTLRDFDLTLDVSARGHRRELRPSVRDPEDAALLLSSGQRGTRHEDTRARGPSGGRLRREVDASRQVRQHAI